VSAISKYTSLAVHNRSREVTAETKVIALSSAGGPRACVLRRTFFEGTAFIDYRLRGYDDLSALFILFPASPYKLGTRRVLGRDFMETPRVAGGYFMSTSWVLDGDVTETCRGRRGDSVST
jgi:hypothetical protein